MKALRVLAVLICPVLLLCAGCASIMTGTTQKVPINSNPSEAKVISDRGHKDITPCFMEFDKNKSYVLTFSKKGYQDLIYKVSKNFNFATVGNIVVGGVIGLGVDCVTGAIQNFEDSVNVNLQPEVIQPEMPQEEKQ